MKQTLTLKKIKNAYKVFKFTENTIQCSEIAKYLNFHMRKNNDKFDDEHVEIEQKYLDKLKKEGTKEQQQYFIDLGLKLEKEIDLDEVGYSDFHIFTHKKEHKCTEINPSLLAKPSHLRFDNKEKAELHAKKLNLYSKMLKWADLNNDGYTDVGFIGIDDRGFTNYTTYYNTEKGILPEVKDKKMAAEMAEYFRKDLEEIHLLEQNLNKKDFSNIF